MVAILNHRLEDRNHYFYEVVPIVCMHSIWKDFLKKKKKNTTRQQ